MRQIFDGTFRVTQEYKGAAHRGIDLVGVTDKNVHSPVSGTVYAAGWENAANHAQGYGQRVWVKSGNSYYVFGHLASIAVKAGQAVSEGMIVGQMGSTGQSTGPHTHFEIRIGSAGKEAQNQNPADFLGIPNRIGTYQYTPSDNPPVPAGGGTKYQAYANSKWLPPVYGTGDYAGEFGKPMSGLMVAGTECRVHADGRWLPPVTGYDPSDTRNGYEGIIGDPIDAVAIKGKRYRVHLLGDDWLPWVTGYNINDSRNGFAGVIGKPIDGIQVE
jgi:hypothetical protein